MKPMSVRLGTLALVAAMAASPLRAQAPPELRIQQEDGSTSSVPLALERGYGSVPLSTLETLGWSASVSGDDMALSLPSGAEIALHLGSPFFRWNGSVLQLTDAPYRRGGEAYVPVQLVTDFFPNRMPEWYVFDGATSTLLAASPDVVGRAQGARGGGRGSTGPPGPGAAAPAAGRGADASAHAPAGPAAGGATTGVPAQTRPAGAAGAAATSPASTPVTEAPAPYDGPRVVIIDAGHGGVDPGALGPSGLREKNVALAISLELAKILRAKPDLEVHLTRDDDTFVEVWDRGQLATDIKGERPGVFISIHANSFPTRRSARGFETYFLAEARTDHERRVAAIENAPLSVPGAQDQDAPPPPDLDFILRELRNLDHQHWSALLAQIIQDEIHTFHPGPDRGVKQGVLAVLTNSLMPSVLVEVGYLSNSDEGKLLGESTFQEQTAAAVARAVLRFFERYPPGSGTGEAGDGL